MAVEFGIKDKEGKLIPINNIDAEAAEFWEVEPRKKEYASPFMVSLEDEAKMSFKDEMKYLSIVIVFNWYDVIGREIIKIEAKDWQEVKDSIKESYEHEDVYEPFIKLINSFLLKDYKPYYT